MELEPGAAGWKVQTNKRWKACFHSRQKINLDNGHNLKTLEVIMHSLSKTVHWVHTHWASYNEMCAIREPSTTTSRFTLRPLKQFFKTRTTQVIPMSLASADKNVCPALPVWPDWAIYWTLGHFLKPLATFNLSKSPTFFMQFCKGSISFLGKSF